MFFGLTIPQDVVAMITLFPPGTARRFLSPPFSKWLCIQTASPNWLADAIHPFEIQHTAFGTDRLKQMRWIVSTVRLCWHAIPLRATSDGAPQPYGRNCSRVSAFWESSSLWGRGPGGQPVCSRGVWCLPTAGPSTQQIVCPPLRTSETCRPTTVVC